MIIGIGSVARAIFNAIIRPQRFVASKTHSYGGTRVAALRKFVSLLGVFVINVIAYAIPLTLAGFGIRDTQQPPVAFASVATNVGISPDAGWTLAFAFVQNSLFITVATGITLVTFHIGIVLIRSSRGVLQSTHTVVYTTSAYLAAIFSGVWYLTSQQGVNGARAMVRNLQAEFVYRIIDLLGANVTLPGGRPETLLPQSISTTGEWVLALLVIAILYYLGSLYFGARVNHRAGRLGSLIAVTAVALSPVVYVAGSIITVTV